MRWTKTGAVALSLCSLLLATAVFAAQPKTVDVYRASKLIGTDVENPRGENLGDIKDVVLDPQAGQIAYAVLGFGGFLGMGEKYFAVPWAALTPKEKRPGEVDKFVLNVDQEKLKNAPGFDKNNWPNMTDRTWGQQVYAYYGIQPYWEHREARLHEATGMRETPHIASITATVQNVDQNAKMLRMRTADNDTVELQAPAGLLSQLHDGDRIEVVIRKPAGSPAAGQPSGPQAPSGQPAR